MAPISNRSTWMTDRGNGTIGTPHADPTLRAALLAPRRANAGKMASTPSLWMTVLIGTLQQESGCTVCAAVMQLVAGHYQHNTRW